MKRKQRKLRVLFNASVLLAGLRSGTGASGNLITAVKAKRLTGVVSEIIFEEVLRHAGKLGVSVERARNVLAKFEMHPAPAELNVKKYKKVVIDFGDAHVLASAEKGDCNFLVTLDKKHLLALKEKIKTFSILTPGEFLKKSKKLG